MNEKQAVLGVITRADGGILCVWNRTYKVWGLPGGKVEDGETLLEALKRELWEECGVVFSPWTVDDVPIIYHEQTYSGSGRVCYFFDVIDYPEGAGEGFETEELNAGIGWMSREFLCSQEKYGIGAQWGRTLKALDEHRSRS